MAKYGTGTIFHVLYNSKNSYWKIIGEPRKNGFSSGESYPCIRCSKNGKEYRDTNGFAVSFVDAIDPKNISYEHIGVKADIGKGIVAGKNKRRIKYLENAIAEYTKELTRLKGELTNEV